VTAPHYGKRNLGLGTAASPGDSLLFNFASFNDSGDSEVLSGFAVSDIEVIKDGSATVRATDSGYSLISDTGMVGDRAGLYRFRIQLFNTADDASFYANGSWYQVFVDSVTIDGKTVRFWAGSFEIGEPRANIVQVDGDTGFADRLGKFASLLSAAGQIDTGTVSGGFIPANVRQINSDTGAAVHLAQVYADGFTDTGLYNRLDRIQSDVDTGIRTYIDDLDTGLTNLSVNINQIRGDTGGADRFYRYTQKLDTGGDATVSASIDTGQVNQAVWQANGVRGITAISDTGINDHLGRIRSDVDTGLRAQIADADTGIHDAIADLDTGIRALLALRDTGAIAAAVWAGDTGLRDHITNVGTGLTNRLNIIASDVDTGLRTNTTAIKAKTDSLTFTVAGVVDANIEYVNATQIQGTGDTGTANTWRPV
jgi:hypothetical protein